MVIVAYVLGYVSRIVGEEEKQEVRELRKVDEEHRSKQSSVERRSVFVHCMALLALSRMLMA